MINTTTEEFTRWFYEECGKIGLKKESPLQVIAVPEGEKTVTVEMLCDNLCIGDDTGEAREIFKAGFIDVANKMEYMQMYILNLAITGDYFYNLTPEETYQLDRALWKRKLFRV